jgi:flotillin
VLNCLHPNSHTFSHPRTCQVEQQEVIRKEKELVATVHRPAEAERFQVETLAEGKRSRDVAIAQGEAESIKVVGAAEASSIKAIGEAEAAAMSARAAAYKDYGDAAILAMILEAMPKIAAEVAAPLSRVDEIVITTGKGEGVTGEVRDKLCALTERPRASSSILLHIFCPPFHSHSCVPHPYILRCPT